MHATASGNPGGSTVSTSAVSPDVTLLRTPIVCQDQWQILSTTRKLLPIMFEACTAISKRALPWQGTIASGSSEFEAAR